MMDGPHSRMPKDTPFTEWTVLPVDDAEGQRWWFHVPTAALAAAEPTTHVHQHHEPGMRWDDRRGGYVHAHALAAAEPTPGLDDKEYSLRVRAAERVFDEEMHLRRFVERVAGMGTCSQTHHEHLARDAARLAGSEEAS